MKKISLLFFVICVLSSIKLLAVSDTAWTLTLPTNNIIGTSFFTEDDSLLIVKIYDPDSSYLCFFNSYTGEIKRKMYYKYKLVSAEQLQISYKDTILAAYSTGLLDSNGTIQDSFNIKLMNYKTGEIVRIIFSNNDPDLKMDTSEIVQLEFSPDGSKLYGILKILDSHDMGGNPIYKKKLFVWDVATGQFIRKYRPYFDYNRTFRIAPNNKYYVVNSNSGGGCANFRDLTSDTVICALCPGDSLKGGTFIFPKDTNHILIMYENKYKIFNLSDFSVESEFYNDTIQYFYTADFAMGARYFVTKSETGSLRNHIKIYDIQNKLFAYIYPKSMPINVGNAGLKVSNNSQLIFDYYGCKMWMYNAKYETTSVKMSDAEEPLLIYPNPTNGDITIPIIDKMIDKIDIYDSNGNSIDSINSKNADNSFKYQTAHLNSGTYFIRLISDKTIKTYKFIKVK